MAAEIPTAIDVGRAVAQGAGAPGYDDSAQRLAARGTRAIDRVAANLERHAQQDDEFGYAQAKSKLIASDVTLRNELAEDPNWQTHESRYTETMRRMREESSKLIRGTRSKALFDAGAELDISRGTEMVRGQASQKEAEWGRAGLDQSLKANRVAALEAADGATREALFEGTQAAIDGALERRYITPEQATNLRQAWTADYGEGYVNMRPDAEQVKLLKDPKDTPAKFIDPEKRHLMLERLEEKNRIKADRREARAERAIGQIERQIASGIPATPQMWKDWNATIAGTSVQGELDELLAGEKQVQEILKKPIAEQIRLVQEKDAALKSGGGSLADAANLQRLSGAVQKNITMLRTDPLLFAETRLDDPNEPLDVASMLDPSQVVGTAATLSDRAVKLRTLQKTVGAQVPMKPLLPQEATQLSTILDASSPAQAADLFANLREASGSTDIFRGIMSQVAPDSPVTAIAGVIAGDEGGASVAKTIVQGERLLNPNKGQKAEDGKPATKTLYAPGAKEMQDAFADAVGNAYAGRPDVALNDMQAVRAYYVGRAAQRGRIAADTTDIDSGLLEEAITAVIGDVVDFNGNGEAIAPRGMTGDEFEDRAERAFASRIRELKLPEELTPEFDDVGLTNAGRAGEYAVTLAGQLLLDARGNPITINVSRPAPRDARGSIVR